MKVLRPHGTTRDGARRRIEDHAAELMERFGASVTGVERVWSGDVLSFALTTRGVSVRGTLQVDDTDATLELDGRFPRDRLFLGAFASRMRSELEEGLKGMFPD